MGAAPSTMPTTKKPAGFLDLPLELRQQIYRECLPRTKYGEPCVTFGCGVKGQDIKALREANPQIASELQDEERVWCEVLWFLVSPTTKWEPPPPTKYLKLTEVVIKFDKYRYESPLHSFECQCSDDQEIACRREKYLATMFHNLTRFVAWFKEANDGPLDFLDVNFRGINDTYISEVGPSDDDWEFSDDAFDYDYDRHDFWNAFASSKVYESDPDSDEDDDDDYGTDFEDEYLRGIDPRWCKLHYNKRGKRIGATLATREVRPGKTVTLMESVLRPLQDFPIVKDFVMWGPDQVSSGSQLRAYDIHPEFDWNYLYCLEKTWNDWLKGKRETRWRSLFRLKLLARMSSY